MTLAPVEGDFAAIVQVTGEISPSLTLPEDRQGNDIPSTFQGAGLLLYQDKDNFVRFERTAGVAVGSIQPIHRVLFEVVKDGKQVESQKYPLPPEGPAYLFLVRRKGRVLCASAPTSPLLPWRSRGSNSTYLQGQDRPLSLQHLRHAVHRDI